MRDMYYISHPYTGDEEKNKKEAREITARLKTEYPQHIFINPLDTFQYTEGWPYEQALKNCIELLCNCDGIIMTGDWQKSRGCKNGERFEERKMRMEQRGEMVVLKIPKVKNIGQTELF